MKQALSLDLRERIVAAYDAKEGTREEVAKRFRVSLGLVKKLVAQRNRTGDLRARYRYCGRKARLEPEQGARLKALVQREPDLTLVEIKERMELKCTIGAIHWVLKRLGLTYKKDAPCSGAEPARCRPSAPTVAAPAKRARSGPVGLPR